MAESENKQTTTSNAGAQPAQAPMQKETPAQEQKAPAEAQPQQAVEQAKETAGQVAGQVKEGAQQVTEQLKGGIEQLKKIDVQQMFKAAPGQPAVTQYEKLLGGVSYIPLAPIVTLVLKGDSNYVKLHGRQSIVLTAIFFLCLFLYLIPTIGAWIAGVIQLIMFILGVFCMYQALVGNWFKIPVLGDIAEMIPIGIFVAVAKEAITGQPKEETAAETKGPEAAPAQPETGAAPAEQAPQAPPGQQPPPGATPENPPGGTPPSAPPAGA